METKQTNEILAEYVAVPMRAIKNNIVFMFFFKDADGGPDEERGVVEACYVDFGDIPEKGKQAEVNLTALIGDDPKRWVVDSGVLDTYLAEVIAEAKKQAEVSEEEIADLGESEIPKEED